MADEERKIKKENDVNPDFTEKDKENASNFFPVKFFFDQLNLDEHLKKDPEILKLVGLLN